MKWHNIKIYACVCYVAWKLGRFFYMKLFSQKNKNPNVWLHNQYYIHIRKNTCFLFMNRHTIFSNNFNQFYFCLQFKKRFHVGDLINTCKIVITKCFSVCYFSWWCQCINNISVWDFISITGFVICFNEYHTDSGLHTNWKVSGCALKYKWPKFENKIKFRWVRDTHVDSNLDVELFHTLPLCYFNFRATLLNDGTGMFTSTSRAISWLRSRLASTILCLLRTTVTSLSTPKDTRCKTHPLCVNPGVPFWTREKTHKFCARWQASSSGLPADVTVVLEVRQSIASILNETSHLLMPNTWCQL